MDECIDDELLAELLGGTVDEERRKAVEAHIDQCSRCHATLAAFGRAFSDGAGAGDGSDPSVEAPRTDPDEPDEPRMVVLEPGTVVGARYRIVQMVGAGGMGVVYRAHDPELTRDVALKLIRTGWFAGAQPDQLRSRLIREAQAMARVRHANVVSIFDVGEHEGGVFLAADFIEGRTLREWLDAPGRTWRDVLRLFLAAGEGLAAANAAGIVHRDFKPANVLVDDRDVPYVTDFGLACGVEGEPPELEALSTGELAVEDHITRTGAFVGTPAYAAPEQLRGEPSPASDQFSFCVALFEGLYGQRPFAGKTIVERIAAAELGRIEPAARPGVPRRLYAEIVRGLAARPGDRHPSMAALLVALRRAARGSLRRFGPAAAVLGAIAAAGIGYGLGGTAEEPCRDIEGRLGGVWDESVRQQLAQSLPATAAAGEAGRLVEGALDEYAAQWVVASRNACERTLIRFEQSQVSYDMQLRCLSGRLEAMRAVIDLVGALGPDVHRAVVAARGLSQPSHCARLDPSVETPPVEVGAIALVDDAEAKLARAEVFARGGEPKKAHALATEALAAAEEAGHSPTQARARFAIAARARGTLPAAEYEAALFDAAAFAAKAGADRTQADALTVLAFAVGADGSRFDEGIRYAELALALFERVDGVPDNADALNSMGAIENARGTPAAALPYLERAHAVATDPAVVHAVLSNMAVSHFQLGRLDEAEAGARRTVEFCAAQFGTLHPNTLHARLNLGVTLAASGKVDEALPEFEVLLDAVEKRGPTEVALRAMALSNLGMGLVEAERVREGLPYLERAVKLVEEHPDEVTLRHDEVLTFLAGAYVKLDEWNRAAEIYGRAWRERVKVLPEDHPDVGDARGLYGHALVNAGRCGEAKVHLVAARKTLEGAETQQHTLGLVVEDLATCAGKRGAPAG